MAAVINVGLRALVLEIEQPSASAESKISLVEDLTFRIRRGVVQRMFEVEEQAKQQIVVFDFTGIDAKSENKLGSWIVLRQRGSRVVAHREFLRCAIAHPNPCQHGIAKWEWLCTWRLDL